MYARLSTLLAIVFALALSANAFATEVVRVTNKSGKTVKVKVYRGLIAKERTLKNGASFSWNRNNTKSYSVRVYYKQGKLIKVWKLKSSKKGVDYSSDVTVGKGFRIHTSKPRHTVIRNNSGVALVVRVYNAKDGLRWIAKKSFTIQPGRSATWRSAQDAFHIKAFELRDGLNKHVATQVDIPRPANVIITNKGGWDVVVRR